MREQLRGIRPAKQVRNCASGEAAVRSLTKLLRDGINGGAVHQHSLEEYSARARKALDQVKSRTPKAIEFIKLTEARTDLTSEQMDAELMPARLALHLQAALESGFDKAGKGEDTYPFTCLAVAANALHSALGEDGGLLEKNLYRNKALARVKIESQKNAASELLFTVVNQLDGTQDVLNIEIVLPKGMEDVRIRQE